MPPHAPQHFSSTAQKLKRKIVFCAEQKIFICDFRVHAKSTA